MRRLKRSQSWEWRTVAFHPAPVGWRIALPPANEGEACEEVAMPGWLVQDEMVYDEDFAGLVNQVDDEGLVRPAHRKVVVSRISADGEVVALDDPYEPCEVFGVLEPQQELSDEQRKSLVDAERFRLEREAARQEAQARRQQGNDHPIRPVAD